jgi:uncharacterized protein YceH (UPF0502 family)
MAYIHAGLEGDDEDASVDGTPTEVGPVSQAQARAAPDPAWRAANLEAEIVALRETVAALRARAALR